MRQRNSNTDPAQDGNGTAAAVPRTAEPGTIAICFVAAALQSVRDRNLDADELLAQRGAVPSLLQVPQARVSAKHYGALWRTIALALDDEFFGQDSRRMKAGSFAMLCHSVLGCKTLGQALDRSLRFYALILDDISGSLSGAPRRRESFCTNTRRAASQRVFAHELLLMLLYGVSCWLVGRRIPILRTEFSYAATGPQRRVPADVLRGLELQSAEHRDRLRGELPGSAGGAERAHRQGVLAHRAGEHLVEI